MRAARGWRALLQLAAVIAGEAGAAFALHRLGALPFLRIDWSDLGAWLALTPPEDVLLAVCRTAALACAYWLLAGTLLYTLARASRIPAAVRAVQWAALPPVRRLADRAIAVAIATSSVVSGTGGIAMADASTPPPVEAPAPDDLYRPVPAGEPAAYRAIPGPQQHVIVPGENLWTIAADHLSVTLDLAPDAVPVDDLAAYWRQVIDANLPALASGDPDLVYPGEVILLPPR
jgi:hypothetical protein